VEWSAEACRANAARFDLAVFNERLRLFVDGPRAAAHVAGRPTDAAVVGRQPASAGLCRPATRVWWPLLLGGQTLWFDDTNHWYFRSANWSSGAIRDGRLPL